MYCSRRGRDVPRPTDTCNRCGRCNWEQHQDGGKAGPALLAFRIQGEEAFLEAELPGYAAYQKKVKYRLLPFVW